MGGKEGGLGQGPGGFKGEKSWSPQEKILSCQEFSSFSPLNGPEQILFSRFQVSPFRMNYGSALAWPQKDAREVPGQWRGVGACPARFRGPPPPPPSGQRKDAGFH